MARARNLKPSFFKNEHLVELPFATRLLFAGLWTLADREGRLEDRPKRVKMEIFPGDDVNVDRALTELHNHGFIFRYAAGGGRYIQILAFKKHQNPHHKEPPSKLPNPGPECLCIATESEADDVSEACETQGTPQASPSTAVLIPDSLNLNPESGGNPFAPSASPLDAGGPINGVEGTHNPASELCVVERIPIVGGEEWPVMKPFVEELDRLYPAVDPAQTLREIRGWCIGNPTKRKTKRGVRAFIVAWFAREQDKQSRRPS